MMPDSAPRRDVPHAWAGPWRARGLIASGDLLAEPELLDRGWWFVLGDFAGRVHGWRFADVQRDTPGSSPTPPRSWRGPPAGSWHSSLDEAGYLAAVNATRRAISADELAQVNICRVLSAPLGGTVHRPSAHALAQRLAHHHSSAHAAGIDVPGASGHRDAWLVGASPELFLRVHDGRITAAPVKGTAATRAELADKDYAESTLVAEGLRDELAPHCEPGSAGVSARHELEQLPGLVQLVARVTGELATPLTTSTWATLLGSLLPPLSVAGLPREAALRHIARTEPVARGPYCGVAGWLDAERGEAELAVTIRSFWWEPPAPDGEHGTLRFGTGAGITSGSDPATEWRETELKAERLLALATDDKVAP